MEQSNNVAAELRFVTWLNEQLNTVTPEDIAAVEPQTDAGEGAIVLGVLDHRLRAMYALSEIIRKIVEEDESSNCPGDPIPDDVLMRMVGQQVVSELFWAEIEFAIPTALGGGFFLRKGWQVTREPEHPPQPQLQFVGILIPGDFLRGDCTDPIDHNRRSKRAD